MAFVILILFEVNGWALNKAGRLGVIISLLGYGVYFLSKENDLIPVATNLDIHDNRKLVITAFRTLGWDVLMNTKYVVTAGPNNKKWWRGAGQTVTALIAVDVVYLNVIHGGSRRGRSAFYYGSNQRKLKRALAAIKSAQQLQTKKA
ncbi:hypothetical protein [Hymenobacter gelipurpurascens]|uniref:hypothetical protein n=1 Tax=Hymenobacter gelipurpurascens TaxID=89968 RepID=UPI0011312C64|nr:hypothetical protein [Hymenobacter gelipurpurascens]